jgi:hypothetical protein
MSWEGDSNRFRGRRRFGTSRALVDAYPSMPNVKTTKTDAWIEELREARRQYIFDSLTLSPNTVARPAEGPGDHVNPVFGPRGLRAPEDECEHGRLEGDRTPPCGCFAGEARKGRKGARRDTNGRLNGSGVREPHSRTLRDPSLG